MTTFNDDINDRVLRFGTGLVETEGVDPFGFQDPSGEYPRNNYQNASSIFNTSSYQLNIDGSIGDINLEQPPLPESHYNKVQIKETASGHVMLMDDTLGAERFMIMHRSGSGVEMRPDGTMIFVSKGNRIEVVGGDNNIIIEGDANVSYNGNLNMNVSGDMNLEVGGEYKLTTGGSKFEKVGSSSREFVNGNRSAIVKGNDSTTTVGNKTNTNLGGWNEITKGDARINAEGNIGFSCSGSFTQTSEGSLALSSPNMNIIASNMTLAGDQGTIGGQNIQFYGYNGRFEKTLYSETVEASETLYSQTISADAAYITTVHGDLNGTAKDAEKAITAALGAASSGTVTIDSTAIVAVDTTESAKPTSTNMDSYLNTSKDGVKKVKVDVDNHLKNMIDKTEANDGVTNRILSTKQVISKMKNPDNCNNSTFIENQIVNGKLNPNYANTSPPTISEVANTNTVRGVTPVGNAQNPGKYYSPATSTPRIFSPDSFAPSSPIRASTPLAPGIRLAKFLNGSDPTTLEHLSEEERTTLSRHLYLQAYYMARTPTGTRVDIEEGIYRQDPNETIASGSLAESALNGRTIVYRFANDNGQRNNQLAYEAARHWSTFNYHDSIVMDYHAYNPTGQVEARVILTVPTLAEDYSGFFNRTIQTNFNGQKQSDTIMLIE